MEQEGSPELESHERHYTVEQANAALPWVGERLERIRESLATLEQPEQARAFERLETALGGGYPGRAAAAAVLALMGAATQLEALDIVLRDPRRGLVDFPSIRDGVEVYLCWQLDEQRVEWWHEPEAGFAGRQPL
ncbi:MAG: DUF2203 domain-containing protein [Solirubrobacterales bacterium]